MYSPLAQDQMRITEEQIRRQVATAHQRAALRYSPAAGSEPTDLARLWLTLTGTARRGRATDAAADCRAA